VRKLFGVLLVVALVLTFSLVATTPVAGQTDRLVPDDYPTIQDAVDDAVPGDTIIVEEGHIAVEDRLIIVTDGITLTTDGNNPATIRYEAATTHSTVDIRGEDVVLENFIIERNNGVPGSQAINVRRPGVIVRGTTITGSDNSHGPSVIPGIHLTTGDPGSYDISLEGVVIKDNHISGDFCFGVSVTTYTDASIEASIEGNTFVDLAWDWYDDGNYRLGWGVDIIDTDHVFYGGSIYLTITDNTFYDVHGVYVFEEDVETGVFDVTAKCNDFLGSGYWGVWNGSGFVVHATDNWWGDSSGPYHPDLNPTGTGNAVSYNVDFEPWAKAVPDDPAEVETATETGDASFRPSRGCMVELEAVAELPAPAPRGVSFPHGMFSFEITCINPGDTVQVTIELPQDVAEGTVWWKHDGTRWYSLPNLDDNGDNVMVIALTDGGLGDSPESDPGTIVDPGGPGNPVPPLAVGWEGSPVNTASVMAPWIALLSVIASASLLVLRRRQTQS